MTAKTLKRFASMLSNFYWCKHWLDYPCVGHMAVQCRDACGVPARLHAAIAHGMQQQEDFVYTIRREEE